MCWLLVKPAVGTARYVGTYMHRAQGGPREKASLSYNPDHRQKDQLAVGRGEGYQLITTLQECPPREFLISVWIWRVWWVCSRGKFSTIPSNVWQSCKRRTHHIRESRVSYPAWIVESGPLKAPCIIHTYPLRCFDVAGPSTWNSLPDSLRDASLSLSIFRRHLKTLLPNIDETYSAQ